MGKTVPNNTRCLFRDFNPRVAETLLRKSVLARVLRSKTLQDFSVSLNLPLNASKTILVESTALHSVGHAGIGGEVRTTRIENMLRS